MTGNKQVMEQNYSFLSLFTGAGGLDLGFETQGFRLLEAVEINPWCVKTLKQNRPQWKVSPRDIHQYEPNISESPDVLLAGFPCRRREVEGKSKGSRRAVTALPKCWLLVVWFIIIKMQHMD